jgi:hypothetical protein
VAVSEDGERPEGHGRQAGKRELIDPERPVGTLQLVISIFFIFFVNSRDGCYELLAV